MHAARPPPHARVISLRQIVGFVLPWNITFKASRVLNTLFALELGATPWQIGLLLAMYGLFPMLFAAYVGKIADHHGVRMPLYLGLTLLTAGVALPFVLPTFMALFIAAAVSGAGFILAQVAMQTLTGSRWSSALAFRNAVRASLNFSCFSRR